MAIVTISHEMGSGGAEIGLTLAQRLGYRHVDHEVIPGPRSPLRGRGGEAVPPGEEQALSV